MVESEQLFEFNQHEDNRYWTWYSWQVILLLTNATLGLAMFEWAWWKNRRFRKPIAELELMVPAFRRNDAERWSKWKFYPGAVTMLLPRLISGVFFATMLCLFVSLALCCQPMNKPITGCSRAVIRWAYKFVSFMINLLTNFNFVTWHRI